MTSLEDILQQTFDCQNPFDEDGELTHEGELAFSKLEELIFALHSIDVLGCEDPQRIVDRLYDILNISY